MVIHSLLPYRAGLTCEHLQVSTGYHAPEQVPGRYSKNILENTVWSQRGWQVLSGSDKSGDGWKKRVKTALKQIKLGWVLYFSKHDSWTKILKSSSLPQYLRSRWDSVPTNSWLYRLCLIRLENMYVSGDDYSGPTSDVLDVVFWVEAVSQSRSWIRCST